MLTKRATTLSPASIEQFRASLFGRGRSEKTVSAYATDLRVVLRDLNVDEIPEEEYSESVQYWMNRNRHVVASKTTGRRMTSVRSFAAWAGWGPVLVEYKAPPPGPSVPHPIPEGLDGVRRMIGAAANRRQAALVALCGLVGCRVGEALAVRPSDFQDNMLRIKGKGEKIRFVPVSSEAWGFIAEAVTAAFIAGDAQVVGIEDRTARSNITKIAKAAGLQRHVASHDLRATFATAVHDRTLDMNLVRELLGHSSVETTQIYVGIKRASMVAAVEF